MFQIAMSFLCYSNRNTLEQRVMHVFQMPFILLILLTFSGISWYCLMLSYNDTNCLLHRLLLDLFLGCSQMEDRSFRTKYQALNSNIDETEDEQEQPPSENIIQILPDQNRGKRLGFIAIRGFKC